jgi:lysozyme family protein
MEKSVLDQALDYVFVNEGGFSNVPTDHGGATRYGITRAEASRWRRRPVSVEEMKAFPIAEAKAIYDAWYFKPLACDRISSPAVAIAMFDIGVVRGISVPPKYAQMICNAHGEHLTVDGHLGQLSLLAINKIDPAAFVRDFSAKAEAGFRAIAAKPGQGIFLKGWVNRARRLLTLIGKHAA